MPKKRVKRHAVTQPLNESYRLIPLTQGQNAIVDAADFEWLSQWNWYARLYPRMKSFYATKGHRGVMMQDVILGEKADHVNFYTLDNRRQNLRKCTIAENNFHQRLRVDNTTGFKGVGWRKRQHKWAAQIRFNKRLFHLGLFDSKEQAAHAYDIAAKNFFGEFAHLNFQ